MKRIAVYTIAKNEEQFVKRWYLSCQEADQVIILDTGSTDKTVEIAKSLGIDVHVMKIDPWRFDVARNKALELVDHDIDYCIALDMDEVLVKGWREHLDNLPSSVTRPRYKYVWSWKEDGSEGLVYGGDKIHSRHGYFWKGAVHEVITPTCVEIHQWTNLQIEHYPDDKKSRSQYFPLLELAVNEDPEDPRNSFYLGREYYYHNRTEDAISELTRFLSLPKATWKPERAAAMRMLANLDRVNALKWLMLATKEASDRRENWLDLALHFYNNEYWEGCYSAITRCLDIKEKQLEYLNEDRCWGSLPYDIASIAAYHMKQYKLASKYAINALSYEPNNERIKLNLELYDRLAN